MNTDRLYKAIAGAREAIDLVSAALSEIEQAVWLSGDPEVTEENPLVELTLWVDGGTRERNPGMGYGSYVIEYKSGARSLPGREGYGFTMTNNEAEYQTLKYGLRALLSQYDGAVVNLTVRTDSQLIEGHVQGIPPGNFWKVKAKHLERLVRDVRELLGAFNSWQIQHAPREDVVKVLGH